MKLDFAALARPAANRPASRTRGQAGTAGTRDSSRASTTGGGGDTAGTRGDGHTAAGAHDARASRGRPQPSPQSPRATAPGQANGINASPVSRCVPGAVEEAATDVHADDEAFEERAAIMEFDGGLSRAEAEAAARVPASPTLTTNARN